MKNVFIVIIVLVIILISIFFTEEINIKLAQITSILANLCSIITVIIAILLYQRYGIEKTILEKQQRVVFKLIETLKETYFQIYNVNTLINFKITHPYEKVYESNYSKNFIFTEVYSKGFNHIWEFCDNLYLPKNIASSLRKFEMVYLDIISDYKLNENDLIITHPNYIDNQFGVLNGEKITFFDFINLCNNLNSVINEWIEKNSVNKAELNYD